MAVIVQCPRQRFAASEGRMQTYSASTSYEFRIPSEPFPLPIQEPPDPPENPDAPVREPDPEDPGQI
jgi:hypothetical protein